MSAHTPFATISDRITAAPSVPGGLTRRGAMLAGGAHLVLLAVLGRLVLAGTPAPSAEWTIPLVFAPAAPSLAETRVQTAIASATLPSPRAEPVAMRLRPLPPAHVTAVPPQAAVLPGRQLPRESKPGPPDDAAPPPAAAPAPAPPANWVAAFTGRVQAAVQRAAFYPMAARALHRQGRVRVRFAYEGGAASDPEILVSSSQAMLDRAALRAVQSAIYPPAPLGAPRLTLLVWVDFQLTPES